MEMDGHSILLTLPDGSRVAVQPDAISYFQSVGAGTLLALSGGTLTVTESFDFIYNHVTGIELSA